MKCSSILLIITILISCQRNKQPNLEPLLPELSIEKYDSLRIKAKGATINNVRQGYWITFWENGVTESEVIYVNDTLNGKYKSYSETGKMVCEGYMLKGRPFGIWIYYYPNGKIQSKGERQGDKPVGEWESYYENGSLKEKKIFPK
jgi:antitoxin component YwqK of YwqJK toxin-antitoxin module